MKTTWKKNENIERKWYLIDLDGQTLGRAATQIASLLIGKGKVDRVPNMDCGDYVVAINCEKIKVTGNKLIDKIYYRHTGYPGGIKAENLRDLLKRDPKKVIWSAVNNMLPHTKLRTPMINRFYVYEGAEHQNKAQKPEKFELTS